MARGLGGIYFLPSPFACLMSSLSNKFTLGHRQPANATTPSNKQTRCLEGTSRVGLIQSLGPYTLNAGRTILGQLNNQKQGPVGIIWHAAVSQRPLPQVHLAVPRCRRLVALHRMKLGSPGSLLSSLCCSGWPWQSEVRSISGIGCRTYTRALHTVEHEKCNSFRTSCKSYSTSWDSTRTIAFKLLESALQVDY